MSRLIDTVAASDPAVAGLIRAEEERRDRGLQLLAAETTASDAVRATLASVLSDKYAEGYPGKRYHGGCEVADQVEQLAIDRARSFFAADYANVQPISWTAANLAVYVTFGKPNDAILALSLKHGGHQTHGSRANFSGRWFSPLHYELRPGTEDIDYDQVRELAMFHRPRFLVAGGTSYPRTFDFAALRAIADEAGCVLWVDGAHLMGMAAGGVVTSPVPYADVVTVATNKVLRGPRGGMLLARQEHAEALSRAVFPFLQGGPSLHTIAGKAVMLAESATDGYRDYARTVHGNAAGLTAAFADRGLRPITGGTDTHIGIVEVDSLGVSGREAQRRLEAIGIVVDRAVTPFDARPVTEGSAIRFGTAVLTTDGFTPDAMPALADLMIAAMRTRDDETARRTALAKDLDALRAE